MHARDQHSVLLQRHALRRTKSIPTVSLILGDRSTALSLWNAHVGTDAGVLAPATTSLSDFATEYLGHAQVRAALHREVSARAARALDVTPRELSTRMEARTP